MMHRVFALLSPCLLLVCCEKPASSDERTVDAAPERRTPRDTKVREDSSLISNTPDSLSKRLEAAVEIQSSEERGKAIAEVAWNAIEIDPELAIRAFLQLPQDSPERIRLINHYAIRLAEQNYDEAIAWAGTLESDKESSAAFSQIALVLAETDPHRAANLLSESGLVNRDFDVAVVQVVQRWAAQSPADAAAWVTQFPAGPAREAGIRIISEKWLPRDASTAFQWLDTLSNEALRKEALRAMEGVILQQQQDIRNEWLQHADARIKAELEKMREQAIADVGDNIPSSAK